ncbi:MAG TPA: SRPBCC family protein [Baekduia sp.]
MASTISATVTATTPEPRDELFARFIPVQLPDILTGWGPVPAVAATSGQTGPWDTPGSTRTVHLSDGSTARERVTDCRTPAYFAYVVAEFTNPVRHLATEAHGQWWFDQDGDANTTHIRWTYSFTARSPAAALALQPVVALAWRRFMRVGLDRLVAQRR